MLDKQTSISFNLVSVKINYPSAVAFVYIYKGAPEHVSVQGYNSSKWIFPLHTVFYVNSGDALGLPWRPG